MTNGGGEMERGMGRMKYNAVYAYWLDIISVCVAWILIIDQIILMKWTLPPRWKGEQKCEGKGDRLKELI